MADITTTFAGIKLENPIIAASSGFTSSPDRCKKLQDAGVSAVVLKSIFEEQISEKTKAMHGDSTGEGVDMLREYVRCNELNNYITLVENTKKLCSIPVIASICCSQIGEWSSFAKIIEDAGADAIELNIMSLVASKDYKFGEYEERHAEIVEEVKREVSVPVIVKMGQNLTNPAATVQKLYAHGAKDVVLFNRYFHTDINIEKMDYCAGQVYSNASDLSDRLRWTGICSALIPNVRYAVSGGVHDGDAVIKSILAGASAVEVCSAFYHDGTDVVSSMISRLESWMKSKGFDSIDQMRGKLNLKNVKDYSVLDRTQFLTAFHTGE